MHLIAYEAITSYGYALNDPVNAIDPDGNLIIFVNGFMYNQWANQDNRKTLSWYVNYGDKGDKPVLETFKNLNYRPYPGERTLAVNSPTYLGEHFSYWGNESNNKAGVGGLFSQIYDDYNTRYISASADNNSQATDRFAEGVKAGNNLIEQLESGEMKLGEKETIKIIGHSQGAAFAAGMVSVLAKHAKYSSKLEVVHYLSPHQPGDFKHPSNIEAHQWSTGGDNVSSTPSNLLTWLNGGSALYQID